MRIALLILLTKIKDVLKHVLIFDVRDKSMISFLDIDFLFFLGTYFLINFFHTIFGDHVIMGRLKQQTWLGNAAKISARPPDQFKNFQHAGHWITLIRNHPGNAFG